MVRSDQSKIVENQPNTTVQVPYVKNFKHIKKYQYQKVRVDIP